MRVLRNLEPDFTAGPNRHLQAGRCQTACQDALDGYRPRAALSFGFGPTGTPHDSALTLLVNGSFVTASASPNDVDVVILPTGSAVAIMESTYYD